MSYRQESSSTFEISSKVVSLNDCNVGDSLRLLDFSSNSSVYFKFISLGIMPNDEVLITGRAPFGGPLTLKHSSETYFALRANEAKEIKVERVSK